VSAAAHAAPPSEVEVVVAALAALEREHEALLDFIYLCPLGILQLDAAGTVEIANPVASQLLLQIAPGADFSNFFAVMDAVDPELRQLADGLTAERGTVCEARRVDAGRRSARAALPLVFTVTLLKLNPDRSMAVLADVSRSDAAERAARATEERFRAVLDGVRDYAIFSLALDGTIESWNRSAERMFEFTAEEALGLDAVALCAPDGTGAARMEAMLAGARTQGWGEDDGWWRRKARTRFWGSAVLSLAEDAEGAPRGFTVVIRDATRRRRREEELEAKAYTDALTGVGNRRYFDEVAPREADRAARLRDSVCLVTLDVDHFKRVNDTHGHAAGDAVLAAVARAVRDAAREVDVVARIGGEEFAVLLPSTDAGGARAAADRIRLAVEQLVVRTGDAALRVTVSAGVAELASAPDDAGVGEGIDRLLARADAALYAAKRRGRNRVVVAEAPRPGGAPA
jgi:diguanylate cyclase (GGDEF)-like protein/PAS domain S-box-containing protein